MNEFDLYESEKDFWKYNWKIENLKPQSFTKVVIEGDFCPDGHSQMLTDVVSQNHWKPGMNILLDDRKVAFQKTNLEMVRKVSKDFTNFEKKLGRGKTAILMGSLSDFARGRQFEMLTDDKVSTKIQVFMDEKNALSWLNS